MADERKAFDSKLEEIAKAVEKLDNFAVVGNYDADGISATAIVCQCLKRKGKSFKTLFLKQLYSENISQIKEMGKAYLFVDFGSAMVNELKENFGSNFIVLDHHQTQTVKLEDYPLHMNPFYYGFNGGIEISASGISYFFAKATDKKNSDLAGLAIVGACGDMLDFEGKLSGLNEEILNDGIKAGVLEKKNDLRLYGRISRPLVQFLMFSANPVLPDLTANEQNCIKFLQNLEIDLKDNEKWRSYEDLTFEEKKKLSTALILHLNSNYVPEWKIKELIGEVYTLKKEEFHSPLRDAKEFATLLNSCGRHGKSEIAFEVCMGDRGEHYFHALALLVEHRKQLREGIQLIQEKGLEEFEEFYFFDAEDKVQDSIVGIVAGMLYGSGIILDNKPIIAFARYEEGVIKVSGRATKELVMKGLNLGLAFKEISKEFGGIAEGGGHKIAAGMRLEEKDKEKFLQLLNEIIKKQLGKIQN